MNMKSSPNKTEARADKMKNEKKNGGGDILLVTSANLPFFLHLV